MLNVIFYNSNLQKEEAHIETMFDGTKMFYNEQQITEWTTSLPNLVVGDGMFSVCSNLKVFNGNLNSLQTASSMFESTSLELFTIDLPFLELGSAMFVNSSLKKFSGQLPRLTDGIAMFNNCTSLTSFTSALPSLANGIVMFSGCKLDARSLMYIVETLPTVETPANITIGLGVDSEDQMEEFAKAASFDSWAELKQLFTDKNWTATFQYNGAPATVATLNETGQTTDAPIYARLLEAAEDSGQYVSEEDGKFYNLEWGHSVTDAANYTIFGSLLEAYGYFGIIPKEFATE